MARESKGGPLDGENVGASESGPVRVYRLADGRALMLPGTRRPASADALEVLADIQQVVQRMTRDRDVLDELVNEARDNYRLPWSLVGFSVGTTAEAARQRWTA
jgi:hypothetical protein